MQTKTTKHLRFCAKRLKNLFVAPKISDYTHLKTVQRQYDAHTTFLENPSFHGTNVQCHDVYFHVGQNLNESWTDGRTCTCSEDAEAVAFGAVDHGNITRWPVSRTLHGGELVPLCCNLKG